MKKTGKIFLAIASTLVVLGSIIFVVSVASVGWDFSKLSTGNYVTNVHTIDESFNDISIKSETADVVFATSNDGTRKVVCYEEEKAQHRVDVVNGELTVTFEDTRAWYDHIGINFASPKVTLYLPEGEYGTLKVNESTGDIQIGNAFTFKSVDVSVSTGDVKCYASATEGIKIETSTGDIYAQDITAKSFNATVSTGDVELTNATVEGDVTIGVDTGDVELKNVTCKNVVSEGTTGDISLENVVASVKFTIKRSTGDVEFERADASEIFVKTSTGDVEGTLLSDKVFVVETSTGAVRVPETSTGGRCEINTSTGDVKIQIKG